jgi:hypothetical protein
MMISGQLNPTVTVDQAHQPPPVVRLRMKPDGAARGYVDGGWWPWSIDPAAEFPMLVSALGPWVGPVSRVTYHLDTWGSVARKVLVGGRIVRLEGFRSMDPHTVVVIGSDYRRVSLLVVPPDIPAGVAGAVLRSAAGNDSTGSVEQILASNGVLLGTDPAGVVVVPVQQMAEPAEEERWEAEGGRTRYFG